MAYKVTSDCIICAYGNGVALLNRKTSSYYSLDPVGTAVWQALENTEPCGMTIEDLVGVVVERFDVQPEVCRPDIEAFVHQLDDAQLIGTTA